MKPTNTWCRKLGRAIYSTFQHNIVTWIVIVLNGIGTILCFNLKYYLISSHLMFWRHLPFRIVIIENKLSLENQKLIENGEFCRVWQIWWRRWLFRFNTNYREAKYCPIFHRWSRYLSNTPFYVNFYWIWAKVQHRIFFVNLLNFIRTKMT